MLKFALTALIAATVVLPAAAKDLPATIIAMERAGLNDSDRGDVEAFLKLSVPDVVYMDPWQERPIVGTADLAAYYATVFKREAKPTLAGEMSNTHVQVMGDTAVLTFNYVVKKIDDGSVVRRWNAVEVYNKRDGVWRIVNTHWSFTQPKPVAQ